jgi:type 1 glutamine amidotransferase
MADKHGFGTRARIHEALSVLRWRRGFIKSGVMRSTTLFITLSALASTLLAAEPLKVLIIDGQNNHKWDITTPVLKDALESCGAFKVEVSTTPTKGAPADAWGAWKPKFADFAAVVSNYNGEPWPAGVRAEFDAYVKGGGGFVSVHAANNSFPDWKEYNQMIGVGGWGGRNEVSGPWLMVKDGKLFRNTIQGPGGAHGPQHEFVVEVQNADHPITRGLPKRWLHCQDELYSRLRGPAENIEILSSAKSDLTGEQEPNLMVINYGKGRVFHTTLGHADYSMLDRGFYETLQRGTEWVVTGDTKATGDVPADFPTEAQTSVITLAGHPKQARPAPKPAK